MRRCIVPALVFLCTAAAAAQTVPEGWKAVKDARGACRIAVPPDWAPLDDAPGAAIFQDATTAIAVVTSQPGQAFKPLTDSMLRLAGIHKEAIFENTVKRLFYRDRTSRGEGDPSGYSASVPGRSGTCSCRVVFLPQVDAETARKIALTLGPAPE